MQKLLDSKVLLKSLPLLFITGFLLLLTVPNPLMVQNQSETKQEVEVSKDENQDNSAEVNLENGENSVKVDVNNQVNSKNEDETSETKGVCTVTKNGVTETVPSNEVNIDEQSSGDISIKVDCENSSSSSSSSSSSNYKIENKININARSSN